MDFDPLPQQRLAIEAPLGPVLVIAGPGAGKTFCLIGRVNHLITTLGFDPARICAVTFTNRAAEEIAVRLERTIGSRAEAITRGTLHALCLGILREHAGAAGLQKGFGVADETYQRIVLGRLNVHPKRRGALLGLFARRRLQDYPLAKADERLFREYARYLERRNLLDFDDLIASTAALLTRRGDIADALAARWDYLLVDEVQDLNRPQYEIVKRLAAPHHNLFAVGDDEQSIFSWTGADPQVLVRFREEFEIAQPIVLDRNCRCSRQIFETARRVLAENPQLFDKRLTADRQSEHEVRAYAFPDEEAEATWLLDDLRADRAASGLSWGDYAVLYRQHRVGEYLEGRLLRAEIPCRLARGRSIAEDAVIGYVIAALRLMRDPSDPVAVEAFARLVFSEHLMQDVTSPPTSPPDDLLDAVRRLARTRAPSDPDTKKLWRFVYQVENLAALARSHHSLPALVLELLSQSVGPYRNALEERHDELSDPADLPEAVRLAERLAGAIAAERPVGIEPMGGLELALRGMLVAAGLRHLPVGAVGAVEVIKAADGGAHGLALTVFKALQLVHAQALDPAMRRFVTFDLETTDKDVEVCEVVEVGAARVVDGEIVDRFRALIRPSRPISAGATRVHGYSDADVRDAPPFAEVWPAFRAFVGNDVLVAHNGLQFDVPLLRRLATGTEGAEGLVFYDTLPLARSLSRDSAKLEDLALRFGIDPGRAHHALDDAVTLARVFRELERQRAVRARKSVLVNLLDYLGLALAVEQRKPPSDEAAMLFALARFYTLGRYSDALEFYAAERERTGGAAPPVEEVIKRLGGAALMARLGAEPDPAQRYPAAVARLQALMDADTAATLGDAIARLLERVALSTWEGVEVAPDRVNLLTLHSTKGLEFSRVYVVGVEDFQLPGFYAVKEAREDETQEARRLLYVGMTRARDRLVLTRALQRFGLEAGGSRFLEEMGLEAAGVGAK
ncbi:MAG TPA: UvrD-helicase domain-containing protein [Gemmatimonadales bacterium]|nr:UvrD-helicase domain-containing protein [Gemmatimonadales bacterium]